ncbi:unnamed protein product, partial [Rotaria socialis]
PNQTQYQNCQYHIKSNTPIPKLNRNQITKTKNFGIGACLVQTNCSNSSFELNYFRTVIVLDEAIPESSEAIPESGETIPESDEPAPESDSVHI